MDQAFLLRAQRMFDRERTAGLDYGVMVAALATHQSASRTALAAAAQRALPAQAAEPLPELILGHEFWREAAAAQGGCFNRSIAGHGVNGS